VVVVAAEEEEEEEADQTHGKIARGKGEEVIHRGFSSAVKDSINPMSSVNWPLSATRIPPSWAEVSLLSTCRTMSRALENVAVHGLRIFSFRGGLPPAASKLNSVPFCTLTMCRLETNFIMN
jgi:hypothetical protein